MLSWNQYPPPHHSAPFQYTIPNDPYTTQHIPYYPPPPPFQSTVPQQHPLPPPNIAPSQFHVPPPIPHNTERKQSTRPEKCLFEDMGVLTMTLTEIKLTEFTDFMIMTEMLNSINPLPKHPRWISLALMAQTQKNGFA
jgi:hypothetical protein